MKLHPAHQKLAEEQGWQDRGAERISRFAGSVIFVYIHAVFFTVWWVSGGFGGDAYPFNLITLIVSLEAIFLSTFVLISQNRQSEKDAAKAAHDFEIQEQLLEENTGLTREIHKLVQPKPRSIAKR